MADVMCHCGGLLRISFARLGAVARYLVCGRCGERTPLTGEKVA